MSDNAFAIFRLEKAKNCGEMTHRNIHNNRAKGFIATDQSDDRSKIKTVLYGDTPLSDVHERKLSYAEFFKEQLEKYGISKVRKNAVVGFELVLTMSNSDNIKPSELKKWVAKNMDWVINNFGGHNLFSARLHIGRMNGQDGLEETTHLHILLSPFCKDEHDKMVLSANRIVDGPRKCSELQDSYAEAMAEFGLERGLKRVTKQEHKKAKEFWKEEVKKSRELEAYKKMFGEPTDWGIEQSAEFKMTSKPELENNPDGTRINRIHIEK